MEAAKAVLAEYRTRKDARGAAWSADELYTLGRLLEQVQDFPESARYYYALAADKKTPEDEQKGLAGLTRLLLTAPEQPLRVGAGNLALYKSICHHGSRPRLPEWHSVAVSEFAAAGRRSIPPRISSPCLTFTGPRPLKSWPTSTGAFPALPERAELHAG